MRHPAATLVAIAIAGPATAHPGHVAGLAGHDHWVAGAAIGLAIAVGLWGALRGKRRDESGSGANEIDETDGAEAPDELRDTEDQPG